LLTIRTFGLSGLGQHERPRSPSVSRPGRTRAEGTQSTVKLTVERLPESQVRLDIAADETEFAEAVEKAARKVSRDIVLPEQLRKPLIEPRLNAVKVAHARQIDRVIAKTIGVIRVKLYRPAQFATCALPVPLES